MSIANRIKNRRETLGATQRELAKKATVSYASIQAYERGQMPKGDYLLAIARALNCTTDWLLTGEEPAEMTSFMKGGKKSGNEPINNSFIGDYLSRAEEKGNKTSSKKQNHEFDSVKKKLTFVMQQGNAADQLLARGFIDKMYENVMKKNLTKKENGAKKKQRPLQAK